MIFSSILFMYVFLPITILIYFFSPKKIRNFILLAASLFFYAWGEVKYVFLMIFTTVMDYILAILIDKYKEKKKKRFILILAIVANLSILGYFKYSGFFLDTLNSIFGLNISYKKLALPIGISFYTFQTLSYVVDVYLKKVKVQKNIITFGCYVTMFPQLIAGPIVKYHDVEKEIIKRKESLSKFGYGVEKFIFGLGKKVLLANNIGIVWDTISSQSYENSSVLLLWLGIISYTFQIYFDFSGYSDMAIGLGYMFGFKFPKNFNYPYISRSITEFWRRWHISLSTWFKEYVYIPLGGNRNGIAKQCRNILIVWTLTGLWHGASFNFMAWGFYYGILLLIEKFVLKDILAKLPNMVKRMYTMFCVIIGWVFFASLDFSKAFLYIKGMFGLLGNPFIDSSFKYYFSSNLIVLILCIIASTPIFARIMKNIKKKQNTLSYTVIMALQIIIMIISTAYLLNDSYNPFLYFRF